MNRDALCLLLAGVTAAFALLSAYLLMRCFEYKQKVSNLERAIASRNVG